MWRTAGVWPAAYARSPALSETSPPACAGKGVIVVKTILACVLTAMVVAVATATAASLISGSQIAHNTIHNHNIHPSTITLNRLSPGVQKIIRRVSAQSGAATTVGATGATGTAGPAGAAGATGAPGAKGSTGEPGADGLDGLSAVTQVSSLSTDPNAAAPAWAGRAGTDGGTNGPGSVAITAAGAQFGPFADSAQFADVQFHGLDGLTLDDLSNIIYTASYTQSIPDQHGGMPYFRIFTVDAGNVTHDIVFSPNTQSPDHTDSGRTVRYDVLDGTVRYDDDAGFCEQGEPWDTVLEGNGAAGGTCDGNNGVPGDGHNPVYDVGHGSEVITKIVVEAGDSISDHTTALVTSVTLQAKGHAETRYDFGL
jgi:hypothetical protein